MDLVQYSVVLTSGNDVGLRQWIWADGKSIERAVEVSKSGCPCDLISGGRGFLLGGRCVVAMDGGSLGFFAGNEDDANYFAVNHFKLPKPFLKRNGNYILNRFGE